jgi:hypothetical protein
LGASVAVDVQGASVIVSMISSVRICAPVVWAVATPAIDVRSIVWRRVVEGGFDCVLWIVSG